MVHTDAGACEHAQPWGAPEERGIDDGIGTDDRTRGVGDVLFAWIGDERDFIAEYASD